MGTVTLELSLLAVALLCPATAMLRIGAFNIQAFGDTKMSNKEVAEIIIDVSAASALWGGAVCWDRPQHGSCAEMRARGRGWDGIAVLGMARVDEGLVGCQAQPTVPLSPPWGHLPWHQGTCKSSLC